MDKSFNDQELSDIMKEIEALEEEFSGNEHEEQSTPVEATAVMEELAEMVEEKSIPVTNREEGKVLTMEKRETPKASKTAAPTSMMFKVQGDMNLELQFDIGGKCVMLEVTEAGLNIQMDGGITFSVPVHDAQSLKKAV